MSYARFLQSSRVGMSSIVYPENLVHPLLICRIRLVSSWRISGIGDSTIVRLRSRMISRPEERELSKPMPPRGCFFMVEHHGIVAD
jgi:hypothetical protein